jgi:hypothetical protein
MSSGKLQWALLLQLTNSGGPGGWAIPDYQAEATWSFRVVYGNQSLSLTMYRRKPSERSASALNHDTGAPSDANPALAWRMLVNPAAEEPHGHTTQLPGLGGADQANGAPTRHVLCSCAAQIFPREACFGEPFFFLFFLHVYYDSRSAIVVASGISSMALVRYSIRKRGIMLKWLRAYE